MVLRQPQTLAPEAVAGVVALTQAVQAATAALDI
jgi:hypothetical protein